MGTYPDYVRWRIIRKVYSYPKMISDIQGSPEKKTIGKGRGEGFFFMGYPMCVASFLVSGLNIS